MQDVKDALPGAFTEHRCRNIALIVQAAGTFQKIQVINRTFLYRFASYTGQFIGFREKQVKVSSRLFIQVFINLKRATLYTVFTTLMEERFPLPFRQFGDAFLKSYEPIG